MLTVYSKPGCTQCVSLKTALDKRGIAYREIDVSVDPEALRHVTDELGYRQMPVVETADDHWCGYRMDKMLTL